MKRKITTAIILITAIKAFAPLGPSPEDEQMCSVLPVFENLAETCPNDLEIQIGVGFICEFIHSPNCSCKNHYENVIQKDKNNKVARARLCTREVGYYTARQVSLRDELNRMIDNARGRNLTVVKIHNEELIELIPSSKDGPVSFDIAQLELKDNLGQEANEVFPLIDSHVTFDPENSVYDYLKAHFYFGMGQSDKAFVEIEKATTKPFLNFYHAELSQAREKVLALSGITQSEKELFEGFICEEGFLNTEIWAKILMPAASEYELKGEKEKAKNIYLMGIKLAKQIREEPVPEQYFYPQSISESIEKEAMSRMQLLEKH